MIVRVALVDSDSEYLDYFEKAVTINYSSKMEVSYYTGTENLRENILERKCDILLISDEFEEAGEKFSCGKVLLTNVPGIDYKEKCRAVYKYQKIENIYSTILSEYAEQQEKAGVNFSANGDTKIFSFISANGGSGKTTVALAMAKMLCKKNKDVLYIPLEYFSSLNYMYPGDETKTLSNIFYMTKENKKNLSLQIKSMIRRGEDGMLFLRPVDNPTEFEQLSSEDWNFFMNALMNIEDIDYIILDHSAGVFRNFYEIMSQVQGVYCVTDKSLTGNVKATEFIMYLQKYDKGHNTNISNKVKLIVNKAWAGNSPKDFEHLKEWIVAYLPDYGIAEMNDIIDALITQEQFQALLDE